MTIKFSCYRIRGLCGSFICRVWTHFSPIGYNHLEMGKPLLIFSFLSAWPLVALVGFANGASEQVRADPERGKEIYEKYCLECHGERGRGDGPRAPLLAPRPGNLVSAATSSKTDPELLGIISNGVPRTAMRGWKEVLTEEDRLSVLAFVRSLVRFQKPSLTPPPPE